MVLSGVSGVEVGTEKAWEVCDRLHLPRILFVGQMDKDHANFERVFADVKAHLSPKVLPVEIPIGEGPQFRGIVNLFSGTAHIYKPGTKSGEYEEVDVPAEYQAQFQKYDRAADRDGGRHRRRPDRALPGRRGNPARAR